jgi:pimeloyl-ACP methyl ester carboxylesterase
VAPPASSIDLPDRLAVALHDRYRLERRLGAGGMAAVFLATDQRHRRQVALKVLAPWLALQLGPERFEAEIRVTANLSHPHILPLFDSGVAEGVLYYVMPYVEGGSLRDRLQSGEALPREEALRIAGEIAAALDHAHARGVVHRDIKPENILLSKDATYVADFGIAIAPAEARYTSPGLPIGTPAYMSPEQIEPGRALDGRADVYALACVTYEMLAGEPPFPGRERSSLVAHLTEPVPPLAGRIPDFPPEADRVLARALAKQPDDRFPRATEFTRALEAACAGVPSQGVEHHVTRPPGGKSQPWRLDQEIRYCRSRGGVRIAWATSGDGPPLIKAANWLGHLEFDAASPIWEHWWQALSRRFRLIRYDERATGLSDWDVAEVSFDAWVADLEAVIAAAGHERFGLLGVSKGASIAIAYAAAHPERVSYLVLHGGFVRGKDKRDASEARLRSQLEIDMVRLGWGGRNAAFRQAFTTMFFPGANPEQAAWFNELQRISTSPENAARILSATRELDVQQLAPAVRCPTVVFHTQEDARVPFREGELMARLIPGARFVALPGGNHLPFEDEPGWTTFLQELDRFTRSVGATE